MATKVDDAAYTVVACVVLLALIVAAFSKTPALVLLLPSLLTVRIRDSHYRGDRLHIVNL